MLNFDYRMKKKSFWLITALMTIALVGVVVMQLYYIRQAYDLNSKLFEQNVNQALNAVVNKVQRRNAADHITRKDYQWRVKREQEQRDKEKAIAQLSEKYKEEERKRKVSQQKMVIDDLNFQDSLIRAKFASPEIITEAQYIALESKATTPLNVDVNIGFDSDLNVVSGGVRKTIRLPRGKTYSMTPDKLPDSIRYLVYSKVDGQPLKVSLATIDGNLDVKFRREDALAERRYKEELKQLQADTTNVFNSVNFNLVEETAKEMQQERIPITQRISKDVLDTLIKKELLNKNIDLQYDFWVKLVSRDSVLYKKVSNTQADVLPSNTYQTTLFSNDIRRDPGMLYINFPNKNASIFRNMGATMASSGLLLLVLIFIFSYTLYAILKQKKISEMKTDFINNMTHEFKTPVSTIMIASEALRDPEITADQNRVKRLAGIIYDENVRLGNHIERVLSIARLEKKELQLERTPVDMNELVAAVADSMNLQLQKKSADLVLHMDAENPVVKGDELHLSNVIYNLIDNANKYSREQPHIEIRTRNSGKSLVVEIADKGIGMTKDQTKRIFDQFYRVPTGNLHDVKGFGLGLNYVQDIVSQLGGNIKVQSEKDKGTVFEISLPLN
ncbi:two-component system phosphate regulon sensor histidine kinase PhoR [Pedobacter nutrimenti]|uniref:histidine kinase n=2 Tax=Pedobacter nutrimenti TaxID=1241337 RepID=A0A318UHT7_9SPHI|nr:two-component system phosphate regulon sensor histidine kinase PhoR [Pedobacter nutrimenti]